MFLKYSEIWDKITSLLKEGFDSKLVYDDKYLKTKRKSYNNRINTNFQGNKIPKDNECCACSQLYLEECKCGVKKEKKIMNAINEELNLDKSDDESYNDRSNESDEDQSYILSYFLQI